MLYFCDKNCLIKRWAWNDKHRLHVKALERQTEIDIIFNLLVWRPQSQPTVPSDFPAGLCHNPAPREYMHVRIPIVPLIGLRRPRYVNYYRACELPEAPLRAPLSRLISRWSMARVISRVESHRGHSDLPHERTNTHARECRDDFELQICEFHAPKIPVTFHLRGRSEARRG